MRPGRCHERACMWIYARKSPNVTSPESVIGPRRARFTHRFVVVISFFRAGEAANIPPLPTICPNMSEDHVNARACSFQTHQLSDLRGCGCGITCPASSIAPLSLSLFLCLSSTSESLATNRACIVLSPVFFILICEPTPQCTTLLEEKRESGLRF